MTTLTTAVANHVCKAHNKGRNIFNDRLKDGSRSLKVWGWELEQYTDAAGILKIAGCSVKIKRSVRKYSGTSVERIVTRLHVKEPA